MPKYMVERYLPSITTDQLAAARAKKTMAEMSKEGTPTRFRCCLSEHPFDSQPPRRGRKGSRRNCVPCVNPFTELLKPPRHYTANDEREPGNVITAI